jgi:hypothetical protein
MASPRGPSRCSCCPGRCSCSASGRRDRRLLPHKRFGTRPREVVWHGHAAPFRRRRARSRLRSHRIAPASRAIPTHAAAPAAFPAPGLGVSPTNDPRGRAPHPGSEGRIRPGGWTGPLAVANGTGHKGFQRRPGAADRASRAPRGMFVAIQRWAWNPSTSSAAPPRPSGRVLATMLLVAAAHAWSCPPRRRPGPSSTARRRRSNTTASSRTAVSGWCFRRGRAEQ